MEKAAGIKITGTDSLRTNNDNKSKELRRDVNKLRMTLAKQLLHLFKKILKKRNLKFSPFHKNELKTTATTTKTDGTICFCQ